MAKLFLKEKHLNILKNIFAKFCPQARILAYGSRIKDSAHNGSDLDLALINKGESKIDLSQIKFALTDSNLPFLVDIFELDTLPKNFQKEILKNHIVIYDEQ